MEPDDSNIHPQARLIAYNVYCYFRKRTHDQNAVEHKDDDLYLTQLVSTVTGLSKSDVKTIIEEGNRSKAREGHPDFKAKRAKVQPSRKKKQLDENIKSIIRRKVLQYYAEMNEIPTVHKLNIFLRKEDILKISNDNLIQLLLQLGFKHPGDIDSEIVEHPDIALDRLKYLQRIKMFRNTNTNIYFLSETLFWHLKKEYVVNMPNLIVVHANGPSGFSDGEMLKMRPHTPMNLALTTGCRTAIAAYHFADYTWVQEKLVPFMDPKSLIVIDSPHYKPDPDDPDLPPPTTMKFSIAAMKVWLDRNNIPYKDYGGNRTYLVNIIKSVVARRDMAISKLLVQLGFSVIHIPQNHADLNPIRMMWENIENNIKIEDNNGFSAISLLENASKAKWEQCFEDIKALEDEYYKHDMEMDDAVDNIKSNIKQENIEHQDMFTLHEEVMLEPEEIKAEPVEYEFEIEGVGLSIKTEPGTSD